MWDQAQPQLVITFDRPMDTSRTGAPGSFTVADAPFGYVGPELRVWLDDRTLRLRGWEEPEPGATGQTWSYLPLSNPLRAADGVPLAAISDAPWEFPP